MAHWGVETGAATAAAACVLCLLARGTTLSQQPLSDCAVILRAALGVPCHMLPLLLVAAYQQSLAGSTC